MTEQPPVTPENPQDTGEDITPPTQTEKDAQAVARAADLAATEFSAADHRTYSMALYNQPGWIVDSVFSSGTIDPNTKHTQAEVQAAIDAMMNTVSTFDTGAPQ